MTGPGAAWTGMPPTSPPPRISRALPGNPHQLPAPPGGHGGQTELAHRAIPAAKANGPWRVTHRNLQVNVNRYGRVAMVAVTQVAGVQIRLICCG